MKTCPKCGGENLDTAASCRLCAIPLEAPESLLGVREDVSLAEALPSTVIVSGQEPANQHAPVSDYAGHTICPTCQAANEPEWLFCQNCGNRLPARKAQAPGSDSVDEDLLPDTIIETLPQDGADLDETEPQYPAPAEQSPPPDHNPPPEKPVRRGYTTSLVCDVCGALQPTDGQFCNSCGSPLFRSRAEKQAPAAAPVGVLKLITEGGEPGATYTLDAAEIVIGRAQGDITFPHDKFMSGSHARLIRRDGRYYLRDEDSRNGIFIQIGGELELTPGDTILVGKQILRFEKDG